MTINMLLAVIAVLLGLLVTGAVDFGHLGEGAGAWGWSVFSLSLAITIGFRLSQRPRHRRPQTHPPPHSGPGGDAFAAAV